MSPAIGFRVWRIDEMLTGPRLASPHRHAAWLPGVPLKAECKDESGALALAHPHRKQPGVSPPIEGCTCGIYAYHEADDMVDALTSRLVGGAVVAWGRITIHQEGFRAEFARPLALCYQQMLVAGSTALSLARVADVYRLPMIDAGHIAVFAAEFGESYLPLAEPSDDWTARLGTSVRRVFGTWFRG
jgi:hypothetical protein